MTQGLGDRMAAFRVHQMCEAIEESGPTRERVQALLSALDDLLRELDGPEDSLI